jgi:hypothetical protein
MTHGEMLALSQQSCSLCFGLGSVSTRGKGKTRPCSCVWRGVFRACLARFHRAFEYGGHCQRVGPLDAGSKARHKPSLRMREEDFLADFVLLAKRALRDNPLGWKLFRFHVLLGADWKLCARKLGIDRGTFFHELYRVQEATGKVFAETQPYALYPTDEYFGGTVRAARPLTESEGTLSTHSPDRTRDQATTLARHGGPLRAPLARCA